MMMLFTCGAHYEATWANRHIGINSKYLWHWHTAHIYDTQLIVNTCFRYICIRSITYIYGIYIYWSLLGCTDYVPFETARGGSFTFGLISISICLKFELIAFWLCLGSISVNLIGCVNVQVRINIGYIVLII